MKTWDRGAPRVVANNAETFGLQTLQTTIVCHSLVLLGIMSKGKAAPLQAWSGPEGSRKLRFPDFMTKAQDGGKVVSLTHRPTLPPGNAPGINFCLRLNRPQGHSAIGRILCQ